VGGVLDPHWPGTSLLGRLGEADRAMLLTLGRRVRYPAAEALMREGEESDFVLILLGGMVKVTAHALDGREALLAVRMAGDLVGEFAGIDGKPRAGTVTACGSLLAQRIGRAPFLACLHANPGIAMAVNEVVVAKMRTATGRIVDFAGCDVLTRLARMLHYLALTYPKPGAPDVISAPLSQAELATLVGASDSAVGKALRTLRARETIDTRYRTIGVRDLAALSEIAFGGS
jgi:CRP-like cAMP-binding protein